MKITRKQIRRIIREEIETLSQEEKTISAEQEESAMLARDHASELETVDAWAGGPNLVHPIDFEDIALTDDKVVRGHQVLKIVENIMSEGRMAERHAEIEDAVLTVVGNTPGIPGLELVTAVQEELGDYGMADPELAIEKDEVFSVLDNMLEDGTIFFDDEEDAWHTSLEDLMAYREGGVWSDDEDYEAGWYR